MSDTEDEMASELKSHAAESDREILSVRNPVKEDELDQEHSEEATQQAIGYQKEIKKTLGKTSETDAYLKFEMTSYVKCQTDL